MVSKSLMSLEVERWGKACRDNQIGDPMQERVRPPWAVAGEVV